MEEATVTLDALEYQRLLDERRSLYDLLAEKDEYIGALHAAGVGNWDGYDFAMDMIEED